MADNEELCLSHDKAFRLKEDYTHLMRTPYITREGRQSNWFEVIVAPYEMEVRKDFLEQYLIELPFNSDYNLLKQYSTRKFTVLVRYGFKEGPTEIVRPLTEIIGELNLPFNKGSYTD